MNDNRPVTSFGHFVSRLLPVVLFLGLLLGTYLIVKNDSLMSVLERYVARDAYSSVLWYISALFFATVFAPVSAVPLMPLASHIFGPFMAGVYSIAGWFLGAIAAFLIARYFGGPVLEFFISKEKISRYEKIIPRDYYFISVFLLRMITPVDFLSYALGFFTAIPFRIYSLATILGIIPFAFIYSYGGNALFNENYGLFFAIIIAGVAVGVIAYYFSSRAKKQYG